MFLLPRRFLPPALVCLSIAWECQRAARKLAGRCAASCRRPYLEAETRRRVAGMERDRLVKDWTLKEKA